MSILTRFGAPVHSPAAPFTPDDLDPYPPADDTGLWLELAEARLDQAFAEMDDVFDRFEQSLDAFTAALDRAEAS